MRINVLLLTYCQENLIGRAIESVMRQKDDGLNELIICDDCSTDNTWKVINDYAKLYPSMIRAFHNEKNLGIYGNCNKLVSIRGKADLFCFLSGDDELCDGWFRSVTEYVKENNVRLEMAVGFFSDWETFYNDGKKQIFHTNSSVNKDNRLFGLHLRGMVSTRSMILSQTVMNSFIPVDTTKGVGFAESSFNNQWMQKIEMPYYIPFVGSRYYAGIGVSSDVSKLGNKYYTDDLIRLHKELLNFTDNREDRYFILFRIKIAQFHKIKNPIYLIISVFYYVLGMRTYGYRKKHFCANFNFLFLFVKRHLHYHK